MANPCSEYFGTHPCMKPRGHAGPHGRPERTYTESDLKLERAAALREAAEACREALPMGAPKNAEQAVLSLIPAGNALAEHDARLLGPMLLALERIIEVRDERDKVLMVAEAALQKAREK